MIEWIMTRIGLKGALWIGAGLLALAVGIGAVWLVRDWRDLNARVAVLLDQRERIIADYTAKGDQDAIKIATLEDTLAVALQTSDRRAAADARLTDTLRALSEVPYDPTACPVSPDIDLVLDRMSDPAD